MGEEAWFFIINPRSGGGRSKRKWPELKKCLEKHQINFRYQFTDAQGHAVSLVQHLLQQGVRAFVVVGGDGTVNEVVNGFFSQDQMAIKDIKLTVMPWGTGNDWAAYYHVPNRVESFVAMLKQGSCKQHDVGCVNYQQDGETAQRYFVNFAGAGFDSYTLNKMGSAEGTRLRYFWFVLKCLRSYRSPKFTLNIQNNTRSFNALLLLVCIGRYGGAGMKFAPEAQADDGLFNVLCVGDMPFLKRLLSLVKLFDGKINQHPKVQTWMVEQLSIESSQPLAFQCDGELIAGLPIALSIMPQQLTVVTPNNEQFVS